MINNGEIRSLQDKLTNLTKDNRDLLAKTVEAGKEMNQEEWNQYNKRDDEITKLDEQLHKVQEFYDREERLSEPVGMVETPQEKNTEPSEEFRAKAFDKLLVPKADRSGKQQLTPEERAALQTDDLPGGGYNVVPERFMTELLKKIEDTTYMRSLCTNHVLLEAVSLGVPTLETAETDADWQGEVATVNASTNWVFGKRELSPHLSVKLVKASRNYVRNAAQPVADFVRDEFARLFGETEENAFLTGNSVQKPLGVFTASSEGISTSRDINTGNSTTAIVANNLFEVAYSLKEGYFNRSTWIAHRDWVKKVRLLKDDNGQYLWEPGIAGNRPATIVDRPYKMSEFAPNTFTASQYVAILGDFSYYWIVSALDLQIQVLNELYAATNQIGWIGRMEVDGMPVFEEAFARQQLAAS